jgi:ABC-type bacteriocin/lantibiotic exporter with double-glycine peptidase domain
MDDILAFVLFVIGLIVGKLLPSYFSKKGENLATKEDISEITQKIEEVKIEFSSKSHTLIKKRETYEKICRGMQVFIQGQEQKETKKNEMLEAYSIAWLWANDAVLKKLNTHIKLQVEKSQNPRSINQAELKKSYTECILEMRKDSGYKDTNQEESDFQFISF